MEIIIIKGINNLSVKKTQSITLCYADKSLLIATESYKGDTITGLNIFPQQLHIRDPSCFTMTQTQEPDSIVRLSPQAYPLFQAASNTGSIPEGGRIEGQYFTSPVSFLPSIS